jgi:hypothetical protein
MNDDIEQQPEDPIDAVFRLTQEQIEFALKQVMAGNDNPLKKGRPTNRKVPIEKE